MIQKTMYDKVNAGMNKLHLCKKLINIYFQCGIKYPVAYKNWCRIKKRCVSGCHSAVQ